MFEHGDQQEIGVSGVTLSGGQRARISLARAVYSRAGTLLVDDLLSSLDTTTSQYVYAHCLKGHLLEGRRIIMVSHNISLLLPTADLVIQLKDGGIAKAGTAQELREDLLQEEEREVTEEFDSLAPPVVEKAKSVTTSTGSTRRIYQEEHQESGNVHSSHYRFVLENVGGIWYWTGLMIFVISAQVTFLLTRFIIQFWTADPTHNNFWIAVWASIAVIRILLTSMRWFWLYGNEKGGFTMRAAARMHNAMVDRILRAPLRFYDRTPEGRILNRFSNDIQRVDGELPDGVGRTIMESLEVVSNILVLSLTLPVRAIASRSSGGQLIGSPVCSPSSLQLRC
jgi:ABC-type multidrug transport system fused ATPase/permease subunit